MTTVKKRDAAEHKISSAWREHTLDGRMLISQVSKVEAVDPLSFFAAGLQHYEGERFYWADPARDNVLVGLGHEYEIEAHGGERFEQVTRSWQALLRSAIVEDDLAPQGTGPLLFGGFSFDPKATKTSLWKSFPDASLVLPTFLLTVMDGEYWLTVNRFIEHKDDAEVETERLHNEVNHLIVKSRRIVEQQQKETESSAHSLRDIDPDIWKGAVEEATRQIRAGVMDKVALAREIRVQLTAPIHVSDILRRLCDEQEESFIFAIERGDDCFVGASPERLVKRIGDKFYSMCLASSIGRGATKEEDTRLGQELLQNERFRLEHEIVVQMIKEAMETGCEHVHVPAAPTLFKAKYIQHLYTPVVGKVRSGTGLLSMVKKLHPTPALGGYPQKKAVEKIRELEALDRGWYAAPVGWIDQNGNGEFIGAIRCGLIRGVEVSLFVGNGIVGDSDVESEFAETQLKPRPMLSALGGIRS